MTQRIKPVIRPAIATDLKNLVVIENTCFSNDRLSKRSLRNFVLGRHCSLLIAELNGQLQGYILVLFRRGTSLARMYSLAVMPQMRGQGLALQLCQASEAAARSRHCIFMRLEVRVDNADAIALYESLGYHRLNRINHYYEDGQDAWQYEKRILTEETYTRVNAPYYRQTTDFTCGPASLMMAMKAQDSRQLMERSQELRIWKEATTIFMTSGHGGTSPFGLALSAWNRGFNVTVYINSRSTPFIDSVRDPDKKAVIEIVHADFKKQLEDTGINVHYTLLTPQALHSHLERGHSLITLISTWRLNRNKAPHWIFVAAADQDFVYLHDPDVDETMPHPQTDFMGVPIPLDEFVQIACFGRSKLRATVIVCGLHNK
jgi:ribosomal protein S18 acetylase RimI-like enzyme